MTTSSTSPQTIADAVTSEGRSWGLSARIIGDKVKVCDTVPVWRVEGGCMVLDEVERPLCTVDDEHPFSGALHNRVSNGETDLARRFRETERREKAARAAAAAEFDRETKRQWTSRRRIFAGPSGVIPAGLTNRSY